MIKTSLFICFLCLFLQHSTHQDVTTSVKKSSVKNKQSQKTTLQATPSLYQEMLVFDVSAATLSHITKWEELEKIKTIVKMRQEYESQAIWQEYLDIEEREKALLKENDRSLYFIVIEDEYLRQGASLSSLAKRFPKIKNYVTNTKKAFDTQEEKQRSNEKIFRTFLEKLESLPTKQHIEYTEGVL